MKNLSLRDLLEAGVHFGHPSHDWNPKMAPFIYGKRDGIHIFNLEKTLVMLREAMNYLGSIAARNGKILFVATKPAATELVKAAAIRCNMPYINHRWLGGLLTNYKTMRNSIKRLKALENQFETQHFGRLNKKEILDLQREKEKLENSIGGIKNMGGLPAALFVIDVGNEHIAVKEANKLKIPVIGVVDSVDNPSLINYVIPGNDDATGAINLYLDAAVDSILNAKIASGELAAADFNDEFVEVDAADATDFAADESPKETIAD